MTPNDVKIVANNIDDFIEVPDGIERLRKAVLILAASGKLVTQDLKEGTAEELYSKIQVERRKNETGATGRKRKVHEFPILTAEEIPYQIPSSWKWVRLGEIVEFRIGKTPPRKEPQYWSDAKIPWVSIADLNAGGTLVSTKENINKLALDKVFGGYIAPKGTLLFSFKLTIGKMSILGIDACHNEAIAAFFPINDTLRDYLFNVLPAINTTGRTSNAIKGKTLNSETIALIEIPLPPLAEQKRIVKKVEEVMKQLDELETKKRERDETRARLARSAMQSLGQGKSKIAFERLTELVKTPEDLKELEGALLTLAVSGKLMSQIEKDGLGEALFKQVQSKREKIKKPVELEDKDKLFPIPTSWSWVRLEDVFDVRDGTHDSPKYHATGYPLVTSKNLYYGALDFLNVKYISEADYKKINERSKVDRDDILFAMIGSIGNPVIVDTDTEFSIKNVALFKYYDRKLSEPKFLLAYLRYASQNMRKVSAGGVQSFVSLGFLRQYLFPLPPLAEQKRIVKKVEEIMLLVNQLKQLVNIK